MLRRFNRTWQVGLAVLAMAPAAGLARPPRAATLHVVTSGEGLVTSSDRRVNCGADCSARYRRDTMVRLQATPAEDFTLTGWRGGCIGTAPRCVIAVDRDMTARATFSRIARRVSLVVGGPGTVVSEPPGLQCGHAGSRCTATFGQGTAVRLTALAASDSTFDSWGGAACEGVAGATCDVMVQGDFEARATFRQATPEPGSETISVAPANARVVSDPSGIDCTGPCSASFPSGTRVTLHGGGGGPGGAAWGGACAGSGFSCTVVADGAISVTAVGFGQPAPPPMFGVNVSVSGPGRVVGRASRASGRILCGRGVATLLGCEQLYYYGETVELRAVPRRHARFGSWQGFCAGRKQRCTLKVTAPKIVIAVFRR